MRAFGAFIDWCMRNFLRLIIIAAILFFAFGFILQTCEPDTESLPARVEDMDYQVSTYSRIYYTDSYDWEGDTCILHGFWVKEGKKWVEYDRDLELSRRAYGKVEVLKVK